MKTSHPEINRRQCWNLHPHRTPCTACKDICPYGDEIFTRPNLVKDWEPCTDCGLCVSACRSGCIAPSPEQVQRDISPADTDDDTIWIGCERSARKNTVVRACVSAYSWEALAYLALNKKIVLDLTPCGECENDVCAEHLRKVLTRLVEFFGQPLFEARFTLAYEPDDAPFRVKEYSRREMMEQVTSGSKKGTKQLLRMLPGLRDDGGETSQDFRLLLHQYTKQLKAVSRDAPALRLPPARLHPEVLCLRPVREELPGRGHPVRGPARRADPRRHHPVEVQRVRRLRGQLLQRRAGRAEAAPAHRPWPCQRVQVYQDPLQGVRQTHRPQLRRRHLLGMPDQDPHQKAAGGGRGPRQGASGRAGSKTRRRGGRQAAGRGSGSGNCPCTADSCPRGADFFA